MRIDIISVVPELLKSPFEASILKRAIEANLVEVYVHNLRDYTTDNYKSVDDYQFGGHNRVAKQIYEAPEYYFWTHKRWKHKDNVPEEFQ